MTGFERVAIGRPAEHLDRGDGRMPDEKPPLTNAKYMGAAHDYFEQMTPQEQRCLLDEFLDERDDFDIWLSAKPAVRALAEREYDDG